MLNQGREQQKWFGDHIQRLTKADTYNELLSTLEISVKLLGFDYFAYGLRISWPVAHPKYELVNNYPDQWKDIYCSKNYTSIDPTVAHGMTNTQPLLWSDQFFSHAGPLWEDARSFGLKHGWAQAIHGQRGTIGMMTLARSEDVISENELLEKQPFLSWLAQVANSRFQHFLLPKLLPEKNIRLTEREKEIMRWTAEGKSSPEIAIILGITDRTVHFHTSNVLKKLDVNNKTAASVKAYSLNLI